MIFVYEVECYNEFLESGTIFERGFISANDYTAALERIIYHYGEESIESVSFKIFSPDTLLIFGDESKELFDKVCEELSKDICW